MSRAAIPRRAINLACGRMAARVLVLAGIACAFVGAVNARWAVAADSLEQTTTDGHNDHVARTNENVAGTVQADNVPGPYSAGTFSAARTEANETRDAAQSDDAISAHPPLLDMSMLERAVPTALALAAVGLIPAVVLMASSFVRMMITLTLLRQALGIPQVPPNQVLTAIAFLLTILVMSPVWNEMYQAIARTPQLDAAAAVSESEQQLRIVDMDARRLLTSNTDWAEVLRPVHTFMSRQIQAAGNGEDVWLFLRHMPEGSAVPKTYEEVPLQALLPAFVLSELKTAFLIGFQLYLPFLVIDLVVATSTMAMGMLMVPPQAISIPLKLLLFVMVDGWSLVAELLMSSFVPLG